MNIVKKILENASARLAASKNEKDDDYWKEMDKELEFENKERKRMDAEDVKKAGRLKKSGGNNAENSGYRKPVLAITEEQFKKWDSSKQRQWIKDHPNSMFAKNAKKNKLNPKVAKPKTNKPVRPAPTSSGNGVWGNPKAKLKEINIEGKKLAKEHWELRRQRDAIEDEAGLPEIFDRDTKEWEKAYDKLRESNPTYDKLIRRLNEVENKQEEITQELIEQNRVAEYSPSVLNKVVSTPKDIPPKSSPNGVSLTGLAKIPSITKIEITPSGAYIIYTDNPEEVRKSKHLKSLIRWGESVRIKTKDSDSSHTQGDPTRQDLRDILESSYYRLEISTSSDKPKMNIPGVKLTAPTSQKDLLEKAIKKLGYFIERKGNENYSTYYSFAIDARKIKDLDKVETDIRKSMDDYPNFLNIEWFDLQEE